VSSGGMVNTARLHVIYLGTCQKTDVESGYDEARGSSGNWTSVLCTISAVVSSSGGG